MFRNSSGYYGKKKTKAEMLEGIEGQVTKSRVAASNTLEYYTADGARHIRLHDTDILTLLPNGAFSINTGGWNTVTTRARLREFLPEGWSVYTDKARLHLRNRHRAGAWLFRQRINVNQLGVVRPDVSPEKYATLIKMIDAYMRQWRKRGLPKQEDSGGDPWVFPENGKIGEGIMIDWLKTKYVHRLLFALALGYSGLSDSGIAYSLASADRNGLDARDYTRIRRYIRACVGLAA